MEARVPARLSRSEGRRFGLLVGGVFAAVAVLLWWRGRGMLVPYLGGLGGALMLGGLLVPTALGPVYRAWMGLALLLSKVTTPIFMSLIYFLVITPMALIMRVIGRRALVHQPVNGSYWIERDSSPPVASQMERQF